MPRYFREPAAAWREEIPPGTSSDDENAVASVVLFNGRLVSLNTLGTEIWKLCDGKSRDEMVTALLREFDVEQALLEQDVAAFLESLQSQGLLHAR